MAQRVDFGGRAWVISPPTFFLVKYFQFWKLPPLFCINSRDNVYYPIFLSWYIIRIINIEYTVICIISVCRSVKIVSEMGSFGLGKARVGVLSILNPATTNNHNQPIIITTNLTNNNNTASTNLAIIFTHYTTHHTPQYSLKTLYSLIRQEKHTQTILLYHNTIKSCQN